MTGEQVFSVSGQHREPVPSGCLVLRLARPPKDYLEKKSILAIDIELDFKLSSQDEGSDPPHLSVWVEGYTTPEQAYSFLQENRPDSPRKLVFRLAVDEVRQLVGVADETEYSSFLDVLWMHLFKDGARDTRPGADGHAGIVGLSEKIRPQELTSKQASRLRKDLRSKLAELASKDNWLLDV